MHRRQTRVDRGKADSPGIYALQTAHPPASFQDGKRRRKKDKSVFFTSVFCLCCCGTVLFHSLWHFCQKEREEELTHAHLGEPLRSGPQSPWDTVCDAGFCLLTCLEPRAQPEGQRVREMSTGFKIRRFALWSHFCFLTFGDLWVHHWNERSNLVVKN